MAKKDVIIKVSISKKDPTGKAESIEDVDVKVIAENVEQFGKQIREV